MERIVELFKKARYVVAFTGSGISKESGIPTFRGKDGLWNKYDPQELATLEALRRDPETVWRWYVWRMEIIHRASPNLAHIALARFEREGLIKAVITQNVDGLHQRAGSKRVLELHGNIWRARCISCGYRKKFSRPPTELPPMCPSCGSLLRPDVVFFGEPLPRNVWAEAAMEAMKSDLMLVIGTSGVVMPAAMLPNMAKQRGATIVEINPEPGAMSPIADLSIRKKAGEFFKELLEYIEEDRSSKEI